MVSVFSSSSDRKLALSLPKSHLRLAVVFSALLTVLSVDALLRPPGALDYTIMRGIQSLGEDRLWIYLEYFDYLTDSTGAIAMWAATLLVFLAMRWLRVVVALMVVPFAGIINEGLGIIVGRPRPHDESLRFVSLNWEERSFPSGHVVGAVLLYGLLFVVAFSVRSRLFRVPLQLACVAIIGVVGFDRVYSGAHWPSDVAAAYALGGLLLVVVLVVYREATSLLLWLAEQPTLPGFCRRTLLGAVTLDRTR